MPIDRFALMLFGVMLAAGLTIGVAALAADLMDVSGAMPFVAPLMLGAAVLLRVVIRRRRIPHGGK